MFCVYKKNGKDEGLKIVYSVQYKRGYPFFTFYENGKWITRSAKYYEPVGN